MVRQSILILLALLLGNHVVYAATWYVYPPGADSMSRHAGMGTSIQAALEQAGPGDTIELAAGEYFEDIHSVRDGEKTRPITIHGSHASIIHGSGRRAHIVDINHDHHHLIGFTVDGLVGDPKLKESYRDKLIYVHGRKPYRGVEGILIDDMELLHAGGECLRLRYFVRDSEVRHSHFFQCGTHDFMFPSDAKNGEAIYIGTSSTQWADGKNPTADADRSTDNWIHDNEFQTWGNECVDIKEGSEHNLVEHNICERQLDPESAGFDARGDNNIFRYNTVRNNQGTAFRLGGHTVDDRLYGVGNQVYGNIIGYNARGVVKVMALPQGSICDNQIQEPGIRLVLGKRSDNIQPGAPCPDIRSSLDQGLPANAAMQAPLDDAEHKSNHGAHQP